MLKLSDCGTYTCNIQKIYMYNNASIYLKRQNFDPLNWKRAHGINRNYAHAVVVLIDYLN